MKISTCFLVLVLLVSCAKEDEQEVKSEELISEEEIIIEENDEDIDSETPHISDSYLFTGQAKLALKSRFENGYVTGPGFYDDIERAKNDAIVFVSNPGEFRPILGATASAPEGGQVLHTTALYAYAIDNVELANVVSTEILSIVNTNDLYTSYWNNSAAYRWDADDVLWIQTSKVKKTQDSYYLVRNLQTVLTDVEKLAIEAWFKRYADLAYAALKSRLENYIGVDWELTGESVFIPEGVYPGGIENPIQDSNGDDITDYTMAWAQDLYNNRQWDAISYIHSWAIKNNDRERENWARQFFKSFIKFGVFSDGTLAEMWRNVDDDVTKGVFYGWVATGGAVQMAHSDAMANHYPNDKLYDFKTTQGILHGSTNLTVNPYTGGSTTDGVTEKSLLTVLKGQSNYLRSQVNGGWNDIRFFKKTDNIIEPLSTVGTRQPSAIPAIANLYYKDPELRDFYLYNTAVGYPAKVNISEGYLASIFGNEDMGPWGSLIMGAAWFEQENNFFN